eukprot:8459729-Ditylum_brightwellii.AAC.1
MIAEAEKLFTPKYDRFNIISYELALMNLSITLYKRAKKHDLMKKTPNSNPLQNVFEIDQNDDDDEDDYSDNETDSFQDTVDDLDEEDVNAIQRKKCTHRGGDHDDIDCYITIKHVLAKKFVADDPQLNIYISRR